MNKKRIQPIQCSDCGKIYFAILKEDLYVLCMKCLDKFYRRMDKLKTNCKKEPKNEQN